MEGNTAPKLHPFEDVRLIVKSANQQFEDLIVQSEPTWTIRRLKTHLTQVYPSNPTVPEQKLIYSGQLLSDDLVLKDILRSYKDVETENHIFHLVYTPKFNASKPKAPEPKAQVKEQPRKMETQIPPVISSTDGLRHRHVGSSSAAASAATTSATNPMQQQIPNIINPFAIPQISAQAAAGCPNTFPSVYPNVMQFSLPGQLNSGALSAQQAATYNWIQQVYSNYMEQCLKMANVTLNPSQPNAPSIPIFLPQPFLQQNFPAPQVPTVSSSGSSIQTPDAEGPSTSRAAMRNFAPRVTPVIPTVAPEPTVSASATPAPPAPAPAPAENVEQPQPRFPNIVQEEQDNRDWLDSFYSVTRLVALLTLVYFYSSPIRCVLVAFIAVGIYLYHTGFFQNRQNVVNNRNNNNNQNINDHNNARAEPQEQAPLNPTPEENATPTPAAPASNPITTSVTPPEAEASTSLIAFVRTFVVSFFASLLPETPAL